MSSQRWSHRVANLLISTIAGRSAVFTPPVQTVMNEYLAKVQDPNAAYITPSQPNPPNKARVFANNYLNLGSVDVVGFDLDYTLVPYTVELQNLIFSMAREILVEAYRYPKELNTCFFDPAFAVRGLSVDAQNGVLVKLSHLQRVGLKYSYKGKRSITEAEHREYYGGIGHVTRGELAGLKPINDLFSMAEACLIADVIEIFEHIKQKSGEAYSAEAIIDDVQAAIRDVHVSGAMHNAVTADLGKYIFASPLLPKLLEQVRKAGKKLFLCTNRCVQLMPCHSLLTDDDSLPHCTAASSTQTKPYPML
jgi:HAD superfamily 5'-nucleotidase-like hydrolase